MLAAKRLPEVLRGVLTDGVDGAVIMTIEGSVLASEFISTLGNINETSLAAISSSIWNNYLQANPEMLHHIIKFDRGTLAIAPIGKGVIIILSFYFCLFFLINENTSILL